MPKCGPHFEKNLSDTTNVGRVLRNLFNQKVRAVFLRPLLTLTSVGRDVRDRLHPRVLAVFCEF